LFLSSTFLLIALISIRPPANHSSHGKKSPIYKLLTNVTELGINNFTEIALKEGTDVVVLVFYPQDDNKK